MLPYCYIDIISYPLHKESLEELMFVSCFSSRLQVLINLALSTDPVSKLYRNSFCGKLVPVSKVRAILGSWEHCSPRKF